VIVVLVSVTHLSNRTVFVPGIMHTYQVHQEALPVLPRGKSGGGNGEGSQDSRIASFGEPLFEISTYTIDSLNLVIRHKPLFPTAGRHNRQRTGIPSIYSQEIDGWITIILFVGDRLEHHSVFNRLSTRTSQLTTAYLPELIASLSFLGSYSYPAS
jgi:hypothetical protein